MRPIDSVQVITTLLVLFVGIGLHEYAHCKLADAAGDPTPRYYGRVTLNLFKHFDVYGTIMIIFTTLSGFGIGWGKPAPMDPRKMKNPRWDFFAAVAAGPISNFIQATVFAVIIRVLSATQPGLIVLGGGDFLSALLVNGVIVNLSLVFFNLIPLGPLDGHWLLGIFLPEPMRSRWNLWSVTTGSIILLILIVAGGFTEYDPLSKLIFPPVVATFNFLTGQHAVIAG